MWSTKEILVLAAWLGTAWAKNILHDKSFFPDTVLRVSTENISIACESRLSVVINGTSPGPPLYIRPGRSSWIRVYNDMTKDNLTMVGDIPSSQASGYWHA